MWYLFSHKMNLKVSGGKKDISAPQKSIVWALVEVLDLFI